MKVQCPTFASVTSKFIEKPFRTGGKDSTAYDCIGFIYAFLVEMGKGDRLNTKAGELTIDNYSEHYPNMTQKQIKDKLIEVWENNGVEIPVGRQLAGDICIMELNGNVWFPAIWAGQGHVLTSWSDAGTRVVKMKDNLKVIKVRRV